MGRGAKIVCTLGPATESPAAVRALIDAGMDVARLNLSHGSHDDHAALHQRVRQAAEDAGRLVGVLADLQGPKIRLGRFAGGSAELGRGQTWTITTHPVQGTAERASTTYTGLARDVEPGDTILVDDGRVRLRVLSSDGVEVRASVVEGGTVSDHKGVNLPGVRVRAPALTAKDEADLRFALALPVDLVALSFVRRPDDAEAVRQIMADAGRTVPVIAKLEKPEAVEHLDEVVRAFDGVMVARGDLGVELPLEQVPLVQKRAARLAREQGKPVIVATQMLESMIEHPQPTRAEVSDVANAVLDGVDAVMLSAETSVGHHAVAAVSTMARIIRAAEEQSLGALPPLTGRPTSRREAIAVAAAQVGHDLEARALVAFTKSGETARRLASHRPDIPLLAFTSDPAVPHQLALTWGTETFVVPQVGHTDDMVAQVDRALLELGRSAPGELVVIVAGMPPATSGSTNMLRVHRLGYL